MEESMENLKASESKEVSNSAKENYFEKFSSTQEAIKFTSYANKNEREAYLKDLSDLPHDVFVKGLADILSKQGIPPFFRNELLLEAGYVYENSKNKKQFIEACINNLDFRNPEKYFRTGMFIDFLSRLGANELTTGLMVSEKNSEEFRAAIINIFRDIVKNEEGSYFLNLRAKEIFEGLQTGTFVRQDSWRAFKITKELRAIKTEDRMLLSESRSTEALEKRNHEFIQALNKNKNRINEEVLEIIKSISRYFSHELNIHDLVIKERDKPDTEKDKQDLCDFIYLLSEPMRIRISEEFGFQLSDLSLHEQFYFLQFIKNKEAKDIPPIQEFVKKYGKDGLKTFLALDGDDKFGEEIVEFGAMAQKDFATKLFQKYSEIIDQANQSLEHIRKEMAIGGEVNEALLSRFRENIFKNGKNVLAKFFKLSKSKDPVERSLINKRLNELRMEPLIFKSAFKSMRQENDQVNLSEIPSIKLEKYTGENIKKEGNPGAMMGIYFENYEGNYPQEFINKLIYNFDKNLEQPGAEYYVLKHDASIVAFCRFEKKKDYKYFGAFNTNPEYQSSNLGEALFEEAIKEQKQEGLPIKADCDPRSPISKKYIEWGFIAKKFYDFEGVPSFEIEMDENLNKRLVSRSMERKELLNLIKQSPDPNIIAEEGNQINFDKLNQGYLLTHYFIENQKTYAIFERDPRLKELKKAA